MSASDVQELGSSDFRKKYHVVAKLGEGGMALVHLAVVRGVAGVRKLVVLKSVRPELVADSNTRNMFIAEARLAATLSHPNIVQTYEVVLSKGRPILVMEYLDGQPFSRVVRRDRRDQVPLALQLHVLREILSGLEYVHTCTDLDGTALKLVHRDMSPQNVFLTYDGQVKILDFGIAKIKGSTGHTETGEIKGKIRYMAPEQMLGSAQLDRRADLFSVGVMLWEAVTQRRLWEGMADVQVIQTVVNGGVPAPSTMTEGVPASLDAICKRALSHDVDERYESAAAMQQDLEMAIDELGARMSTRQVGKAIAESFSELRASIKAVIEMQLRDEKAAPINLLVSEADGVLAEEAALSGDLWGLPSAVSVSRTSAAVVTSRRRGRVSVAVGALVLASATGAVLSFRHFNHAGAREAEHSDDNSQVTSAAAVPPIESAPSVLIPSSDQPRTVHLQVSAQPPNAKLFLDDALLASDPFSGEVRADERMHTVRAEAPGYRTQSISVSLAQALDTNVKLERLPIGQMVFPRAVAGRASASGAGISPSASVAANRPCTLPYYFDEQGIKRVRPECLK
jgi:serine/threonine protein kinase